MVGSYFGFLVAFFTMGAPLWDRIRAIFTWNAIITFPEAEDEDA